MALKKSKELLPDKHEFGLNLGVKFQAYDYEPIEVSAFYKSSGFPGETTEALADRVAKVVVAELDKRAKEMMSILTQLRKEAFEELSDEEASGG